VPRAAVWVEPRVGRLGESAVRLISLEEGIGKMRAALAGRQDSSLVIAGLARSTRCR